ncbi:MAG: GatB/YqeY domain-containing protein [Anaerolineales bacterium]|nr:GatB/YqeY domain-containing protein [Anaerolineales bacterium]
MPSRNELESDLKAAMRSGDDVRKRTLRMVLSAVKLAEVDKRGELDEAAMMAVLQKEVKVRNEAIQDSERANRPDLVEAARAELAVLQSYLPKPLSDEELTRLVRQAIEETGATTPAEIGKVMKSLQPHVQGKADGKAVSDRVRQLLSAP